MKYICKSIYNETTIFTLKLYTMNSISKNVAYLLILLGILMIYLGGFKATKVILPPIITGIGFFAIAIVFLKKE